MHSTKYIILFVTVLTAVVAFILAILTIGLKPIHDRNEAIYSKRAILTAIEAQLPKKVKEMTPEEVQNVFDQQIEQVVVDMQGEVVPSIQADALDMGKERKKPLDEQRLPVFIYKEGEKKTYIVSVRGSGLWDEIWGNIALDEDFNTISGATFDHKGETPGLGAEIKDNPKFPAQFVGKKLYTEGGEYRSVDVKKGGIKEPEHQVDAISGATITCNGVTEMMHRGLKYYEPYFQKNKRGT